MRDLRAWSGAERRDGVGRGHLLRVGGGVGDGAEAGAGQDVEAEVAAAFGSFVVLLGQHGADQTDQGVPVREDADHVGAAADLAVQPSCQARPYLRELEAAVTGPIVLRGAHVFAPEDLGGRDVFMAGEEVVAIQRALDGMKERGLRSS
jgi:hypothetical protein